MTKTEQGYIAQGYELPEGFTWDRVANARALFDVAEIYVPIALASGVCAWGVPMKDGKFMAHD